MTHQSLCVRCKVEQAEKNRIYCPRCSLWLMLEASHLRAAEAARGCDEPEYDKQEEEERAEGGSI